MGAPRQQTFTTPTATATEARPIAYASAALLSNLLDVSEATVWDWTKKGILPKPLKIGGATRWKWSEVEARMAGGKNEDEDPVLRASRGG